MAAKKSTKAKAKPKRSTRKLKDLEVRRPDEVAGGANWEALKQYKVWDAQRKVFVYPENWINP